MSAIYCTKYNHLTPCHHCGKSVPEGERMYIIEEKRLCETCGLRELERLETEGVAEALDRIDRSNAEFGGHMNILTPDSG